MSEQQNVTMPFETKEATDGLRRAMPFSNEAEQSVLGSMFLDKKCVPDVISKLRSSDFYIDRHKELFEAIVELFSLGKPIDLVTLEEQLTLRGSLDKIGGIRFVVDVANAVPSTENVGYYADIVKDKSVRRNLLRLTEKISNAIYNGDEETDTVLAGAQQGMIEISQGRDEKGLVHIERYITESIDYLDKLQGGDNNVTGISTGFKDLDRRTSGLHPSELIIIAARPGMGKSSLALNIAQNAAVKDNRKVAIFSLEMPGIQIANRLLSAETKISAEKLKKGNLRDDDWPKIAKALGVLNNSGIYIDDSSSITATEIGARCRKLMLEKGLDMVVIDYLQLMTSGTRGGTRQEDISNISRTLKILANDLNIPVIALSQLSRASEKDKREPVLSDLRDSGAIEQDADIVMFIHREGYYKEDAEEPNKTKCNIAKHRNGEVGYEYLTWLGEYTSFSDWSGNREY